MASVDRYVGRFAPSPTGPLHFGSLVAATGSYLAARASAGRWAIRIDNLDRAREVPGAADGILNTLENLGFEWDGPIVYQSRRSTAYVAALEALRADGHVFDCSCSRAEIASTARDSAGSPEELRYPGTCRTGPKHPGRTLAARFIAPPGQVTFVDAVQGSVSQDVEKEAGDFVIRRRDGFFAYQLAVVVDDADLGVTDIVRGGDLLATTPRQILLQQALGLPEPRYAHLPLAVDGKGAKLSKSTQSTAIDPAHASRLLWQVLHFLEQSPPVELQQASVRDCWSWALKYWSLDLINGIRNRTAPPPLSTGPDSR